MRNHPAIVIIAYNRSRSLERLLKSVGKAQYPENQKIPLVISIDKGDNSDVIRVAENFTWTHGEKRVVCRKENLGLKRHVLLCGDYVQEFGSVILLEDDLYVSGAFYGFAKEALSYTEEDDRISGVSLYNHLLNVHTREPFLALPDGYDNWYFQFASSWGQAFTKKQWMGFRRWMEENDGKSITGKAMPANVSGWSHKSWLKYFICYMIETDRYFLYPRQSLTTNFSEEGTHAKETVNDLQVPMTPVLRRECLFSSLEESGAVYDAFFENKKLAGKVLSIAGIHTDDAGAEHETEIDLYGYKPETGKRYLLTARALHYQVIASFARSLRPIDANVEQGLKGDAFFLYDRTKPADEPRTDDVQKYLYHYRAFKSRYGIEIIKDRIKKKVTAYVRNFWSNQRKNK